MANEPAPEPPSLADAAFLAAPGAQAVFSCLEAAGYQARAVGGAVRNALLGHDIADVDIATTAVPETVMKVARTCGLHAHPTGIDHGTVTVVADSVPYEVTTLRKDVETHGRRAVVAYTTDWAEDAMRRDFTMNALYCDRRGVLFDPLGGYRDLLARRVRFIGSARERIEEDYLRILRFFRFFATYAEGPADPEALAAIVAERDGLRLLSAERIRAELLRLMVQPRVADALADMYATGVLRTLMQSDGPSKALDDDLLQKNTRDAVRLKGLYEVAADKNGKQFDPALPMLALLAGGRNAPKWLAERFRLSGAERARIEAAAKAIEIRDDALEVLAKDDAGDARLTAVREAVYWQGRDAVVDALLMRAAMFEDEKAARDDAMPLVHEALNWPIPKFPFSGRDLLALGVPPGPGVGAALHAMQTTWVRHGCPDDEALLRGWLTAAAHALRDET